MKTTACPCSKPAAFRLRHGDAVEHLCFACCVDRQDALSAHGVEHSRTPLLPATFELNGRTYRTDAETVALLRRVVPKAKATGDHSALVAVLTLGQMAGRVAPEALT